MNSTTNVVTAIRPIASGKRSITTFLESTSPAGWPPTSTSPNVDGDVADVVDDRLAVLGQRLDGRDDREPRRVAVSLANRSDAAPGPAISAPPAYEPVRASTRATPSIVESWAA